MLAEHPGPVGFWGISQGARVGLPLLAAEPRIPPRCWGSPTALLPQRHWSLPGAVLRPVR